MRELDASKLVFLDESGFKVTLTRAYGWAPEGERPVLTVPKYGKNITLVGAIALDGVRALQTLQKSLNGERFIQYLDEVLGPALRPGDIVVMDGPRVHRVAGVEETLEKWGAKALYLPPYSPELNPIEMCWSVLKSWVRKRCPRVPSKLIDAAKEAWALVTAELCSAWVRHCGYAVPST